MTYVDPLLACIPKAHWRWSFASHLFADSLDELHAFAARLGLKRAWFQDKPTLRHYDLNPSRYLVAVRLGAIELTRSEAVAKWRELRGEGICDCVGEKTVLVVYDGAVGDGHFLLMTLDGAEVSRVQEVNAVQRRVKERCEVCGRIGIRRILFPKV